MSLVIVVLVKRNCGVKRNYGGNGERQRSSAAQQGARQHPSCRDHQQTTGQADATRDAQRPHNVWGSNRWRYGRSLAQPFLKIGSLNRLLVCHRRLHVRSRQECSHHCIVQQGLLHKLVRDERRRQVIAGHLRVIVQIGDIAEMRTGIGRFQVGCGHAIGDGQQKIDAKKKREPQRFDLPHTMSPRTLHGIVAYHN